MEYNILFGAEVVQIYSSELPKSLYPYIQYYQRRGLLAVLPWTLPRELGNLANSQIVRLRLQPLMIRECQCRYQQRSRFG
ncbi:hypothetical protein LSH36_130g00000 [Paralvinella palmiformis]|uniref:Glycosyltransferase family 92 protein n=1 Tax=Paralvinella palmiformis TaxID=53620 RepID=A0AAD9JYI1_9ANNE|nr:hypothetical protein LSH36_130g00000 [Paralvinella palmiformis]